MKESATDIQKYLNILQGDFDKKQKPSEAQQIIDLGAATAGAQPDQTYIFENGVRWARILEEENNFWLIEHGFVEYDADAQELISKHDMAKMINQGDMILREEENEDEFLLENVSDNGDFEVFMEKLERYLLVNYEKESNEFDFDWREAYDRNLTPNEAAEEAIILEG